MFSQVCLMIICGKVIIVSSIHRILKLSEKGGKEGKYALLKLLSNYQVSTGNQGLAYIDRVPYFQL